MKKHLYVIYIILYNLSLNAQRGETWQYVFDPGNVAWGAMDAELTETDDLLILGAEVWFTPPYGPGIPIDGDPIFGNVLLLIDAEGGIRGKSSIRNYVIGAIQNIPAYFFTLVNESEPIVPYSTYVGSQRCTLSGASDTKKRGLAFFTHDGDSLLQVSDRIYNVNGFCERPGIYGVCFSGVDLIVLDRDDRSSNSPMFIRWYDPTGFELRSKQLLNSNWLYFVEYKNNVFLRNDTLIVLVGDKKDSFRMVLLGLNAEGDSINSKKIDGNRLIPNKVLLDKNNQVLLSGIRDTLRRSTHFLVRLDESLNEVWRKEVVGEPIGAVSLADGGYLLIHNQNRVTRISSEGHLISSRTYGERGNDNMAKILLQKDGETFVIVGTHEIDKQQSALGDPFIRIFVLRDQIDNLDPVNTSELSQKTLNCTIYPNPAAEEVFVEFPDGFGKIQHGVLHDMQGRVLQYDLSTAIEGKINLSGLAPGVYILSFTNTQGHRAIGKLVKG